MKKNWLSLLACIPVVLVTAVAQAGTDAEMQSGIESFAEYLIRHWAKDPKLRAYAPPQIITSISGNTKVIGGCIGLNQGRINKDVGGTSYCQATNTIFVVPEQIKPLSKYFGPAAINYVLAHEYGHYLQSLFKLGGDSVVMELQADCLAGAIIGQGYSELKVNQEDIVNMAMAAYSIGDSTHGSGPQRAYAVFTGLGQSDEITCKTADMIKLSQNQIQDPIFKKLSQQRSGGSVAFQKRGEHLLTISGSLGL